MKSHKLLTNTNVQPGFSGCKAQTLRHTVECRVAQDNVVCANGVNILTGTTKLHFHTSVAQ